MKIIFSSKRFLLSLILTGSTWLCSNAQRIVPNAYLPSTPVSYVRSWDAVSPEINSVNINPSATPDKFKMATLYIDGLGMPIQTVIKQGSLITGQSATDMVSAVEYDAFGREQYHYLPSPANNSGGNTHITDGLFKLNPFQQQAAFYGDPNGVLKGQGASYFYGQTQFDGSPLNRVTKTLAPGNSWQGVDRGISLKYYNNTTNDAVRIWNVVDVSNGFGTYSSTGTYAAGQLFKNVTIDENGKQVIEFKDKEGQVILKKVQLTATDDGNGSGHSGWLCTYYIYDDLNQLRCVIQPRAVELISSNWILTDATILAEQCFRYEYDAKQRMIMKKVPGAGEVYMVYDARDRLVMTQDANLRTINKWMITLYDELNRPVQTGLLLNTFTSPAKTFAQHLTTANTSTAYPFAASAPPTTTYWEFLTKTGYDNYSGIQGGLTNSFDNTWASQFNSTYNAAPLYAQQQIASLQTTGMVTWSQTKILNSSSYLYSVNIYDDKGRVIQKKSKNIVNGTDVVTIQYNWAGQPLINVLKQEKAGSPSQTSVVVTQFSYDQLGRLTKTEEKLSNTLVNGNAMSAYKTVSKLEYDALGQLKRKNLGTDPANSSLPLEAQAYDYNIRGWLLGTNRDYVSASGSIVGKHFGFDLGYDKNGVLGTYTSQYNGNIGGTIWKSEGDKEKRKYDFSYDAVNRILGADFNQYTGSTFNKTAGVDFSVSSLTYDANGNIITMNQKGLKINASPLIDQFNYTYYTNSNRLKNVRDNVNDATSTLGDFKTSTIHPQNTAKTNATTQVLRDAITDYAYDANGNLTKDYNKNIATPSGGDGIHYNFLNLPDVITIKKDGSSVKGTITYTYDAAGNKLKKVTLENNASVPYNGINYTSNITTTTQYISGFVYESKTYSHPSLSSLQYTDVLQFTGHEEGRIRRKSDGTFAYDYFLKDHLGNVRMVLTEEASTNYYPAATMEGPFDASSNSMVNYEKTFYKIDNAKIVSETSIPSWGTETIANTKLYYNHNGNPPSNLSYPAGCSPVQTSGSNKLYKLNATTNKTGLEFVIKVMAGDKVDIFGKSYYLNTTDITNNNSTVLDLVSLMGSFLLAPVNPVAGKGITASTLNTINTGVFPSSFFRGNNSEPTTKIPKAYINYVFLDEQFKFAGGKASRVGASGTVKDHWYVDATALQNITVPKNGYLFVYVSNESNFDVFFDNLQVINKPGPILEETHYYPFGLTMAGISAKSALGLENKYKFTGQLFDDDLGWNTYQMKFRTMDPQIGRFLQVDPLAPKYVHNSTYAYAENDVIRAIDLEGLEKYIVTMRAFIPQKTVGNPNPFSGNKTFAGDNRMQYQANSTSYRTEQKVNADFDNKSLSVLNNTASGSTGYNKDGKVNETSTPGSAGKVRGNVDDFQNAVGKPKSAVIDFETDASNKLVTGAPAISADINLTITPNKDGSFNFSVRGSTDGFPAYELWVTDDKGNSYLILNSTPTESGKTPVSLFPPEDQKYNNTGNSKDVKKPPVVNFSDTHNSPQVN